MHVIAQSEIFQVECDVAIILKFHMPIVTDLTDCDRTGWSLFGGGGGGGGVWGGGGGGGGGGGVQVAHTPPSALPLSMGLILPNTHTIPVT